MRHPAWISRLRARARDNRGVALIEAAILTPVFFVLIFGVMEIGLAMNDSLAVSSTVKAGARMASASGNDKKADLYTIYNIARESSAINRDDVEFVVIYRPIGFGKGPSDRCKAGHPQAGECNVYTAADFINAEVQVREETEAAAASRPINQSKVFFGCKKGTPPNEDSLVDDSWCPLDREVKLTGAGPDYVGVWMKVNHKWVTKMFGDSKDLESQSVIRLEPRSS